MLDVDEKQWSTSEGGALTSAARRITSSTLASGEFASGFLDVPSYTNSITRASWRGSAFRSLAGIAFSDDERVVG